MKRSYKGFELDAKRERSLGGEVFIYFSIFRERDQYEVTSGCEGGDVRDTMKWMKAMVDFATSRSRVTREDRIAEGDCVACGDPFACEECSTCSAPLCETCIKAIDASNCSDCWMDFKGVVPGPSCAPEKVGSNEPNSNESAPT